MKFVRLTQMQCKSRFDNAAEKWVYYWHESPVIINLENVTHVEPLGANPKNNTPALTGISLADGSNDGPTCIRVKEDFETVERLIKRNQGDL